MSDTPANPSQSPEIDKLAAALVAAQANVEGAIKDKKNPAFKGTSYADLSNVVAACKPALNAAGIAFIQRCVPGRDGGMCVRTRLLHVSGQWIEDELPIVDKLIDPQKVGSAITYARRYGLAAMVGVCPEDDDAETAMGRGNGQASSAPRQSAPPDRRPAPPPPAARQAPPARNEAPAPPPSNRADAPTSGKALFKVIKDLQERHDDIQLLDGVNDFGKRNGYRGKIVEWTRDQVTAAYADVMGYLESEGLEPAGATEATVGPAVPFPRTPATPAAEAIARDFPAASKLIDSTGAQEGPVEAEAYGVPWMQNALFDRAREIARYLRGDEKKLTKEDMDRVREILISKDPKGRKTTALRSIDDIAWLGDLLTICDGMLAELRATGPAMVTPAESRAPITAATLPFGDAPAEAAAGAFSGRRAS